jgi:hypothetical protein
MAPFRQTPRELPSFEEISAELRDDGADLTLLLDQLADKLKAELGSDHVYDSRDRGSTKDEGHIIKAPKHADYLSVKFGADTFTLRYSAGVLTTSVDSERQQVPLDEWLAGIHRAAIEFGTERTQEVQTLTEVLEQGLEHAGRPAVSSLEDVDETRLRPSGIAEGQSGLER